MNLDVRGVEALNYLFLRVIGQVFLAPTTETNMALNEMTGAQRRMLYLLELHGPQRMTEVARRVGVTLPAATGVADKLVRAGFVQREDDPEDRRVTRIGLTDKGHEIMRSLNRLHEERLQNVLNALGSDKQEELISCFDRIHTLLSEIEEREREAGS